MSDPSDESPEIPEDEPAEDESIKALLRGALGRDAAPAPNLLGGVQKKLRVRSGGKFYADTWSTTRHEPVATYLLTSLAMLVIVGVVYAALGFVSGEPAGAELTPAPVQIIAPAPRPSR